MRHSTPWNPAVTILAQHSEALSPKNRKLMAWCQNWGMMMMVSMVSLRWQCVVTGPSTITKSVFALASDSCPDCCIRWPWHMAQLASSSNTDDHHFCARWHRTHQWTGTVDHCCIVQFSLSSAHCTTFIERNVGAFQYYLVLAPPICKAYWTLWKHYVKHTK